MSREKFLIRSMPRNQDDEIDVVDGERETWCEKCGIKIEDEAKHLRLNHPEAYNQAVRAVERDKILGEIRGTLRKLNDYLTANYEKNPDEEDRIGWTKDQLECGKHFVENMKIYVEALESSSDSIDRRGEE